MVVKAAKKGVIHMKIKRWRCTVCNYIHGGEQPPEKCPECGVGPEFFELLDEIETDVDKGTQKFLQEILFKIQYGLFVVTSHDGEKINGQVCNTVFQVTSSPLLVAVGVNKENLTHQYIKASGTLTVSVLGEDCQEFIKVFGYQSGRNADKFSSVKYNLSPLGNPVLEGCMANFDCQVLADKSVDLGTHTLFIAQVVGGQIFREEGEPVTYLQYRKMKKRGGKKPVSTPAGKEKKWECQVCGYIHQGEEPPETCPVCGVGREEFILIEE